MIRANIAVVCVVMFNYYFSHHKEIVMSWCSKKLHI